MTTARRTDLAVEAREMASGESAALPGVSVLETRRYGCAVTRVEVLDDRGAAALGKPIGSYRTVELSPTAEGEDYERQVRCVAEELTALLPEDPETPLLVLGLGNRDITPDAVGPLTAAGTVVTRHLRRHLPDSFGHLREVAALAPGVMGDTGLESAEILRGVAAECRPGAVIAVDALAALSIHRLCTTVQLSSAGIVPGSGVGNARAALNAETLGLPVIALGVPTVIDAGALREDARGMIVTPKDIDARVRQVSRLCGAAISAAAHPSLTLEDHALFLG